jgi:hypothetical protein
MLQGSAHLPLLALLFRDKGDGCELWARTLQDRRITKTSLVGAGRLRWPRGVVASLHP